MENNAGIKVYRSILAESWRCAGRELLSHGRIEEAHDCFMRSLSWRVINPSLTILNKDFSSKKNTSYL